MVTFLSNQNEHRIYLSFHFLERLFFACQWPPLRFVYSTLKEIRRDNRFLISESIFPTISIHRDH